MRARVHKPKVTRSDLARVLELLKAHGIGLAAVDIEPGRVRIVTTDGADLTLPDDRENLDVELAKYRATRDGRDGPQGRA